METIQQRADGKIKDLMDDAFSGSRVFQSGGNEIVGNDLRMMVLEAAENSLRRLYLQFEMADHAGWDKVYSQAKLGSPDALKAVADDGKSENNPVCKAIRNFVAGGKKGLEIRGHFEDAPFGWSRDAVDGGLQVLLVDGILRAHDERGKLIDPKGLERKAIGKATFKVESDTVTTEQRIQIRKLLQRTGISAIQGEELSAVPLFLSKMQDLANRAGGDAPRPKLPDASLLGEIGQMAGNSQLLALYTVEDAFVPVDGAAEKLLADQVLDHLLDLVTRDLHLRHQFADADLAAGQHGVENLLLLLHLHHLLLFLPALAEEIDADAEDRRHHQQRQQNSQDRATAGRLSGRERRKRPRTECEQQQSAADHQNQANYLAATYHIRSWLMLVLRTEPPISSLDTEDWGLKI